MRVLACKPKEDLSQGPSLVNWRALFLGVSFVAIPCLFWILATWPGNLTEDSLATLTQIHEGRYDDAVPVSYTLYVQLITLGGRFVATISLVQCVLISLAVFMLARSLGASNRRSIIIVAVMMATPVGGLFACMAWKDVPFVALIIIGVTVLIGPREGRGWPRWIIGVGLLAVGSSFRHNGWPLLLTLGIIFIGISIFRHFRHSGLMALGLAAMTAALLGVAIHGSAAYVTGATPIDAVFRDLPALGDLAYAATVNPDSAPPGLVSYVDSYSRGESRKASATCSSVNGMFFYDGFNKVAAGQHPSTTYRLLWDLAATNPKLVVYLHLCRSAVFLPPPFSSGPGYVGWLEPGVIANDFGIFSSPPFPGLHEFALWWFGVWLKVASYFLWVGLWGLLGTISLVAMQCFRMLPDVKTFITYVSIIWIGVATVAVWALGQDIRYAYIPLLVAQVASMILVMELGTKVLEGKSRVWWRKIGTSEADL